MSEDAELMRQVQAGDEAAFGRLMERWELPVKGLLARLLQNVSEAEELAQDALVAALHSGHLGGASLDVYPQEPLPPGHALWTCPNVILTPHTSGFRQGHWEEVVGLFAENSERFERGEALRLRVEPELG